MAARGSSSRSCSEQGRPRAARRCRLELPLRHHRRGALARRGPGREGHGDREPGERRRCRVHALRRDVRPHPDRKQNPMIAYMTRKIKISGDISAAMALQVDPLAACDAAALLRRDVATVLGTPLSAWHSIGHMRRLLGARSARPTRARHPTSAAGRPSPAAGLDGQIFDFFDAYLVEGRPRLLPGDAERVQPELDLPDDRRRRSAGSTSCPPCRRGPRATRPSSSRTSRTRRSCT